MAETQWDRQVLDFLKRTGEEIKTETQKILDEIRAPENQQKIKDSLNEFGSWAKQTAEEAAGMVESALKRAEQTFTQATDRVLGKPGGGNGTPTAGNPQGTKRAPKTKRSTTRKRVPSGRRARAKRG